MASTVATKASPTMASYDHTERDAIKLIKLVSTSLTLCERAGIDVSDLKEEVDRAKRLVGEGLVDEAMIIVMSVKEELSSRVKPLASPVRRGEALLLFLKDLNMTMAVSNGIPEVLHLMVYEAIHGASSENLTLAYAKTSYVVSALRKAVHVRLIRAVSTRLNSVKYRIRTAIKAIDKVLNRVEKFMEGPAWRVMASDAREKIQEMYANLMKLKETLKCLEKSLELGANDHEAVLRVMLKLNVVEELIEASMRLSRSLSRVVEVQMVCGPP